MIATVRIAPVERWCEAVKSNIELSPDISARIHLLAGMQVQIITAPVKFDSELRLKGNPHNPEVRHWRVTEMCRRAIEDLLEVDVSSRQCGAWLCEHMLDMD